MAAKERAAAGYFLERCRRMLEQEAPTFATGCQLVARNRRTANAYLTARHYQAVITQIFGAPEEIRTPDPQIRSRELQGNSTRQPLTLEAQKPQ